VSGASSFVSHALEPIRNIQVAPMTLEQRLDLLLVTPVQSDWRELGAILAHSRWALHWARTRREGIEFLGHTSFAVVVCDRELPDGSWKDLAWALCAIPERPLLLVACSSPAGLWFDVVRSGGFDVVLKPFERGEVTWALTTAWCHWSDRATRAKAKSNGDLHSGF
jgi:DNA-binding NtrC family response regulator